ncbi:hypothetical protein E2I00_013824 [Balaenoptera physalus]|uniref:GMP reductase n=1 Tax=Balaenoptera physalus TaxID=9770 RepID=A0A643BVZ7_BALPH|nr:hypothetical protein E2I00_013824 [Balaenoptera physalus]
MLGGMFSGHTECAGEVIERNGQKLKLFYGMSSETAMKKHAGGVAEYRGRDVESSGVARWPCEEEDEDSARAARCALVLVPRASSSEFLNVPLKTRKMLTKALQPPGPRATPGTTGIVVCADAGRASEGKTVEVPYKGDVENTILDILGGLRSTCTYVGAAKLKELSRRATFIRVTQQHNTVFS